MIYQMDPQNYGVLNRLQYERNGYAILLRLFPQERHRWLRKIREYAYRIYSIPEAIAEDHGEPLERMKLHLASGCYSFDEDPSNQPAQRLPMFSEWYANTYDGKKSLDFSFIVTNACNLRCSYCYQTTKAERVMPFDMAKQTVDRMFESDMADGAFLNETIAHGIILNFIGGEPLLEVELIDRIITYFLETAKRLDHRWMTQYMISMTSNGTLVRNDDAQAFIRKYGERLSMSITIDGNERLHDACRLFPDGCGSYNLASEAFQILTAHNAYKGTKLTIAPPNVAYLSEAVMDMITKFDLDELHGNCVFEEGWTPEHARILYQQLKKVADWILQENISTDFSMFSESIGKPLSPDNTQNWCGGNGQMRAVNTDGSILPCVRYAKESLNNVPEYQIGTIQEGFLSTPEQQKRWDLLEGITRQSQSTQECLDCPIASGCAWCSAYNYDVHGTPDKRATFICCMHKARVLANAYYQNRRRQAGEQIDPYPMNIPRGWALEFIDEDEYERLCDISAV